MKNSEVARVFQDMADLLELKGENVFKVRAYQKAARSIEHLSVELEQLVKEGNKLEEIPGVGEAIAKKITEIVNTGKLRVYEELKAEFPEGISAFLSIPGVGPKTAMLLTSDLGIKTIDDLEQAILSGKLAALPRMGEKTAENILRSIQALRRKGQRIPLGEALPLVDQIIDRLKDVPGLKNLSAAGSLRRFQETIGDIDLMGTADNPAEAMRSFTRLPMVKEVLASGTTKASVIVSGGLQVDLRLVDHDSYGSLLQYFTGSKQHNINLRERGRKQGLSLSEYGITDIETGKLEKFATEEAFYKRLGLPYIPPEIREGGKEIERAEKGTLPRLIEHSDIKGDLHIHSTWTEGRNTIEEMALAAKELGYEYIAITDHSRARGIAHGIDEEKLGKQIEEIKQLNQKIEGIRILSGVEVDIRADGKLDMSEEILAKLDVVVAAIHSGLTESESYMTRRITKAMESPHIDILAHPTCRVIQQREPIAVDMEALFKTAVQTNTMLEINSMPDRLDIKDTHIYRARELGVKLVISTDAHRAEHLKYMRFGVGIARRGWCEAKDIMNTKPLKEFMAAMAG